MQHLIFQFLCNYVIHRNKAASKDASYLFPSMHTKQYAVKAKKAKWTALTAISDSCWEECVYFGLSLLFFSFSLPPLLITARYRLDQCWLLWLLEGECVTCPGGKAKQAPPPCNVTGYKENPPCEDTMGVLRRWVWWSEERQRVKRALRVRSVPAAGCQDTEITHKQDGQAFLRPPKWPAGREQALQPREVI